MRELVPTMTVDRVKGYLNKFSKPLDKKVIDLYNERFVRYVRMASEDKSSRIFIASVVWAEMRKSTAYKVDLSLDCHAIVQQAQCECGAGQGPNAHCKHVAAVLYGLTAFCETGDIVTELTCTQVLQTFHKSQTFKGSPLKASDMQTLRGRSSTGATGALVFDPRPAHRRNCVETADRFRSVCLNSAMEFEQPMPVQQLYPPANIAALCKDHNYMAISPEDTYLKENLITAITPEQVADIEEETRGQGKNARWKQLRLQHITSSRFGEICKATRRKNMTAFAKELTVHKDLRTKAVMHGRTYEPIAVEKSESKWGLKTRECGLYISDQYPQLAASPDRLVDQDTVMEIKCPWTCCEEIISSKTVPYLKTADGVLTLDKTHDYYYQVQGQLLCSNRKRCIFIVYTFKDIVRVNIKRDDEFIAEMVTKLVGFYNTHFKSAIINKFLYRDYYAHDFQ
jgi:putative phage-type endonuclease